MAYDKAPEGHTEFGGGPGLVDAEVRADRALEPWQERMEIMFTDPSDPTSDPAIVPLGVPIPVRDWPDKSTAKGTS